MNVSCPECRSIFRVDPSKVPASGIRARCSVCGGIVTVGAGSSIDDEFGTTQGAGASKTATPPAAPVVAHASVETPSGASSEMLEIPVPAPPVEPAAPEPVAPPTPAAATAAPPTPATLPALEPIEPAVAPPSPPPIFARPLTPPASVLPIPRRAPTGPAGPPAAPLPPARAPFAGRSSGTGSVAAVRPPGGPLMPPAAPRPAMAPPARVPPAAAPASSLSGAPARTPINPFLANDPNAKARRLSRALISDLVTYFPQRREEGLRDGTLKELFREEIKKSHEEYVDQVGREFADSTTHFQDALNEILAAGRKMF